MKRILVVIILFAVFSGCIEPGTPYNADGNASEPPIITQTAVSPVQNESKNVPDDTSRLSGQTNNTLPQTHARRSELLIDRISLNLSSLYDKKWNSLYQEDELDCSRMATYLWDYIRANFHVAPKIIISYERQHAWLALKVSDTGNSSAYRHWNIRGVDYYYIEATIPKIVVDDNQRFLINNVSYTSAQFYNASIYFFDTPQDANDFHAEHSMLGGWNQEFRLKKDDTDKIEKLIK